MELRTKMPGVGTTIFTVMSQLATEHKAINLGQGFPDFDPDPRLLDEVNTAMREGHNQYPPMPGIPQLREGIQKKVKDLYGHDYDANTEITVMAGASEALMMSILALVHPGDEVIVIEPFYDLYNPVIGLAGGTPVIVPMQAPDARHATHRVDWQRVREAITPKTRALILNFPHNPTGINLEDSDLDELERIVQDTGIVLISDEVYEHVVFDGGIHHSLCRRPSLAAHSVVISSFGKTYHITGWESSDRAGPAGSHAALREVQQLNVCLGVTSMRCAVAQPLRVTEHQLSLLGSDQKKR